MDSTVRISWAYRPSGSGRGTLTIRGAEANPVQRAALEEYKRLEQQWRQPTRPVIVGYEGEWVATIYFNGTE